MANDIFNNITNKELPALLRSSYEVNQGDMKRTSTDLETIDKMLGLMRIRSIINSRDRHSKSRFSRGRGYKAIMKQLLLDNAPEQSNV